MSKIANLEELRFFRNYDENVLRDFLEIALEFLNDNVKNKAYLSAAQKLETDPATVASVIEKLAYFLLESYKLQISESDFHHTIEGILPEGTVSLLWEIFNEKKTKLKEFLRQIKPQHTSYSSLDWRLECLLASRSLQQQQDINVMISLNLKENDIEKRRIICCDIPNLIHMTNVLESALNETRSSHVRKVQRSNT